MGKPYLSLLAILILVALLIASPVVSYASPALPTSVSIEDYFANRNLLEPGDTFFAFRYNFVYSSYPTTPADQVFVFRLFSPDGNTELGAVLPYVYANNGYGQGVVAFYFAASANLIWGSGYQLKISGNPAQFSSIPSYSFTVPSSAYSSLTSMTDSQFELGQRIIYLGHALQTAWGSSYTLISQQDSGTVLSSQGEDYFRNAIYGLQSLAPSIFYLQSSDILQDKPPAIGTSLSDTYKNRFKNTWVQTSLQGGADLFSLPLSVFEFILCAIGCIFIIYKSQQIWSTPYPGYFGSVVIIVGLSLLWMGMTLIALVMFVCIIVTGWLLFFKKA